MGNALVRHFAQAALNSSRSRSTFAVAAAAVNTSPSLFSFTSKWNAVSVVFAEEGAEEVVFPREGPGISYGLNWPLAIRGIFVKDKAFHNLKPSELQQNGATAAESSSGLPILVRGNTVGGSSEISKAQFSKLLKQVTTHISSVRKVFVQDGAIGSPSKCDAKVHVISDSPSDVLSLSDVLWRTTSHSVSHDLCPVTVYVASAISQSIGQAIGLGANATNGFLAVDIEHTSLILCGKAFVILMV